MKLKVKEKEVLLVAVIAKCGPFKERHIKKKKITFHINWIWGCQKMNHKEFRLCIFDAIYNNFRMHLTKLQSTCTYMYLIIILSLQK